MSEVVKKYDENDNCIYRKDSDGYKQWYKFNENNDLIYYKNSNGREEWYKRYDKHILLTITEQEFKQIERQKLYLNNKKINRFEIMDI